MVLPRRARLAVLVGAPREDVAARRDGKRVGEAGGRPHDAVPAQGAYRLRGQRIPIARLVLARTRTLNPCPRRTRGARCSAKRRRRAVEALRVVRAVPLVLALALVVRWPDIHIAGHTTQNARARLVADVLAYVPVMVITLADLDDEALEAQQSNG